MIATYDYNDDDGTIDSDTDVNFCEGYSEGTSLNDEEFNEKKLNSIYNNLQSDNKVLDVLISYDQVQTAACHKNSNNNYAAKNDLIKSRHSSNEQKVTRLQYRNNKVRTSFKLILFHNFVFFKFM